MPLMCWYPAHSVSGVSSISLLTPDPLTLSLRQITFFLAKTQENVCTLLGLRYIEWVKNLYSPHEVHTSYVLFTYDRIVYSQYE